MSDKYTRKIRSLHIKTFTIGAIAGIGGGLVSLGGGTLIIPMLMGWMKMSPVHAKGTAIAVSLFTAGMGTFMYSRSNMLDLPVAVWVALPSLFVTPLATKWSENWASSMIKKGFGLVVILGGFLVIFRDEGNFSMNISQQWEIPFLLSVGLLEGIVAGVIGISGGPVLAPLFVLGLGMPQQLAQGCSLAARLPAVATGTWENWRLENIRTHWIPGLALGGFLGTWVGSSTALWLPEHTLRIIFSVFLIILGGHYLLQPQKQTEA